MYPMVNTLQSNNTTLRFRGKAWVHMVLLLVGILIVILNVAYPLKWIKDSSLSKWKATYPFNESSIASAATHGNDSLVNESTSSEVAECAEFLEKQVMPLPCVEQIREATRNDPGLNDISKTLLLSSLDKLTYERRSKWLSTLNPMIVTKQQLSNITNACPDERIALVLLTNGISNNVQEWLLYHLLMGVKMIIIFDDSVTDSIEQKSFHRAIQPFLDLGYAIRHEAKEFTGEWSNIEISANNLVLQQYGAEYDWIGFIGADEFIVLHQEKCLAHFLKNYTDFGGVVLQWRLFSPLGVPTHEFKRTYFEQYQYTVKDESRHIKSIVQPKYVNKMVMHHAVYNVDKWAVNFRKDRVDGPFNVFIDPQQEFSVVELRHFFMEDMQFALFEKVCGLNGQRGQYRDIRISMFNNLFHEASSGKESSLPFIHDDLLEFIN